MATYTVQGPSGKTYTIEGPEGATAEQLGSHILSQSHDERAAMQMQQDRATYNPTNDMGTSDRVFASMGGGAASVLRAVGGGSLAAKLGLPSTKEEADALDAPLNATTAGKVGRVAGQALTVAPAAFIPGANTYGGAALLGAGLGGATTEGDISDRAKGAAFGAAGGVVGQGVGNLIGAGASRLVNAARANTASRQAANAGRDAAATNAQAAGYVLPPTEINPSMLNSALEGLSGKIKTSQSASARNQGVTNNLAADALGLPRGTQITPQELQGLRRQAGQAYDAVSSSGVITPTPAFDQALDRIVAPYRTAAQGFPNAAPSPVIAAIDSIRSPQFDASAAVAQIRNLREAADTAFSGGDKGMGRSLRQGADALEDAIDTHLQSTGAPAGLLDAYRNARRLIAQTYTVEKGLNQTTGDVSAKTLAGELKKGKPLTNELRQIAETAQAFPKATQTLQQNYNAVSPLDYLAGLGSLGTGVATGHPLVALGALAPAVRPAVRASILSRGFQGVAGAGQYSNPLAELAGATGQGVRRISPLAGLLLPASQK
jgi:hypothetical protein